MNKTITMLLLAAAIIVAGCTTTAEAPQRKTLEEVYATQPDTQSHSGLVEDEAQEEVQEQTHQSTLNVNAPVGLAVGNLAPDFTTTTIDNQEVHLRSFAQEGKPVVAYFFATWCPYCRKDFTALSKVYPEYEDDVEFVAMSLDLKESASTIGSYKDNFPGIGEVKFSTGKQSVLKDFAVRYTTTKYAIGRDGTILYSGSGEIGEDQWRTLLDALKAS